MADSERNNNGKEYRYVNNNIYIRCHIVVLYINYISKDLEGKAHCTKLLQLHISKQCASSLELFSVVNKKIKNIK